MSRPSEVVRGGMRSRYKDYDHANTESDAVVQTSRFLIRHRKALVLAYIVQMRSAVTDVVEWLRGKHSILHALLQLPRWSNRRYPVVRRYCESWTGVLAKNVCLRVRTECYCVLLQLELFDRNMEASATDLRGSQHVAILLMR